MKREFVLAALGIAWTIAWKAFAQPPPESKIQLNWNAVQTCPSGDEVRAEVLRLLGARPTPSKEGISVQARVSQEASSYLVRLEVKSSEAGGPARIRELRGPSCKAVADAAALIMAMMIDPSAAMDTQPDQNEPKASPPAPSSPPASSAGLPEPAPPSMAAPGKNSIDNSSKSTDFIEKKAGPRANTNTKNPSPSLHSFGWFALDLGSMPTLAPGLGIALGVGLGAQRIELGISAFPEATYRLASHPDAGGRVDLLAGTFDTCRTLSGKILQWGSCGAFEIGRLHAEGFGVPRPGQADLFWFALKAGGFVAWRPMGKTALTFRLDAVVPLVRARFILENLDALYAPSALCGRAYMGLLVSF